MSGSVVHAEGLPLSVDAAQYSIGDPLTGIEFRLPQRTIGTQASRGPITSYGAVRGDSFDPDQYARTAGPVQLASERELQTILLALLRPDAPRIFDLGCGPGLGSNLLFERLRELGKTPLVIGLDKSVSMLEHARLLHIESLAWPTRPESGLYFIPGDLAQRGVDPLRSALSLSQQLSSFLDPTSSGGGSLIDGIYSNYSLHWVQNFDPQYENGDRYIDLQRLLTSSIELLRPGGAFVVNGPAVGAFRGLIESAQVVAKRSPWGETYFTPGLLFKEGYRALRLLEPERCADCFYQAGFQGCVEVHTTRRPFSSRESLQEWIAGSLRTFAVPFETSDIQACLEAFRAPENPLTESERALFSDRKASHLRFISETIDHYLEMTDGQIFVEEVVVALVGQKPLGTPRQSNDSLAFESVSRILDRTVPSSTVRRPVI